jgi:hypothetical protein
MSELREFVNLGNAYNFFLVIGWNFNLLSKEDQALAEREYPHMMSLLRTVEEARKVSKMVLPDLMNEVATRRLEELSRFNPQDVNSPEEAKELADIYIYNGDAFQKVCLHWVDLCDEPREINYLVEYLSHMERDNESPIAGIIKEAVSRKKETISPYLFYSVFRSGFLLHAFY